MTPFSDDDLKRLKKYTASAKWVSFTHEDVANLLARLEAAEVIVRHVAFNCPIVSNELYKQLLVWCESGGAKKETVFVKPHKAAGRVQE